MPIYVEVNPSMVSAKWDQVMGQAKGYKYAEQDGWGEVFQHWPFSEYHALGNNSNTFAEYVVKQVGLTWKEMSGYHPGNDWPVDFDPAKDDMSGGTPTQGELGPPPPND
jgi:hypothetical protein